MGSRIFSHHHKRTKSAQIYSTPKVSDDESLADFEQEYAIDINEPGIEDKSEWYLNPIHRRTSYNYSPKNDLFDEINRFENADDNQELFSSHLYDKETGRWNSRIQKNISPYEIELHRLRYEKLKIEEAYLLKLKCKAELERTRGPKAKWYELKSKEFTVEMEKYANLMKSKNRWDELIGYRDNLRTVSTLWSRLES